jgi:hypothetical protein
VEVTTQETEALMVPMVLEDHQGREVPVKAPLLKLLAVT